MTRPLDPVSTSSVVLAPSTVDVTVGSVPSAMVIGRDVPTAARSAVESEADDAAAAAGSATDGKARSTEPRLLSRLSVQLVMSRAAAGSTADTASVNEVSSG